MDHTLRQEDRVDDEDDTVCSPAASSHSPMNNTISALESDVSDDNLDTEDGVGVTGDWHSKSSSSPTSTSPSASSVASAKSVPDDLDDTAIDAATATATYTAVHPQATIVLHEEPINPFDDDDDADGMVATNANAPAATVTVSKQSNAAPSGEVVVPASVSSPTKPLSTSNPSTFSDVAAIPAATATATDLHSQATIVLRKELINPFDDDADCDGPSSSTTTTAATAATSGGLRPSPLTSDGVVASSTITSTTSSSPATASVSAVSKSSRRSSNPFDDESDAVLEEGTVAVVEASNSVGENVTPESRLKRMPAEDILKCLVLMGYEVKCAKSVIKQEKTLRRSSELLRYETLLKGVTSAATDGEFIWKPPIAVSIGSWLPGPPSAGGGASAYISFIITVAPCIRGRTLHAFKVERRYSDFYNLYCALYDLICVVFPTGMKNPFPDDRFSTWIWGVTEDRTNERQRLLAAWMKEIVISPNLMTSINAFDHIRDFLDIKHILDKQ